MPEFIANREEGLTTLEQLASSALRCWGRKARDIRLIKMRENAVFRVTDEGGTSFALRIHRDGYHSDHALRSELQWMSALRHDGIDVPAIVRALDGRLFVTAWVPGMRSPRQIDLLEWLDGRPLGSSEGGLEGSRHDTEQIYRVIGSIAARLHNQAAAWPLPRGFERHRWDLEGLVGEQPFWGRFWELAALNPGQRELLVQARDHLRQQLVALADSEDSQRHFGLIHADFVPENLLLSDDGQVRLIDFDDAGFGWHLFELATALYFIQDDPNYEAAKRGLVEGYRLHRELPDAMLARLPLFMAARGFSYLGWSHTRPGSQAGQAIVQHVIRLACREAQRLLG